MNLELIEWDENNRLIPTCNRISTKDDIANKGARKYHKQVLGLAVDAIEEVHLDCREFQSFVMAVDKNKVPIAKEMIRKFRKKLSKAVSGDGDNIYQTSIQFFQLTSDPEEIFEDKNVAQDKEQQGELLCST